MAGIKITNKAFLEGLFVDYWEEVPICFGEKFWGVRCAGKTIHLPEPDSSNYFCLSLFNRMADGRFVRRKEVFRRQVVFGVDDVGTKLREEPLRELLPLPTYELETSPGNFQWGYVLEDGDDPRALAALVDAIVENKEVNPSGKDPGMKGVTRVMRLPVGANNKDSVKALNGGKPWPHVLHVWKPVRRFTVAGLAKRLGVDLSEENLKAFTDDGRGAYKATSEEIDGDNVLRLFDQMGMLLDRAPNDNGFVPVICPWAEEHTNPDDNVAGYLVGKGGFECHHGHCEKRGMNDVRKWFAEHVTPEIANEVAREALDPVDPDDPELLAERKHTERRVEKVKQEKERVRRISSKWAYVRPLDMFVETDSGDLLTRSAFNSSSGLARAGETGLKAASAIYLNDPFSVTAEVIDFVPGEEVLFEREEFGRWRTVYNTWRPGSVVPWSAEHFGPVTDNDVRIWLDHVDLICPDKLSRETFLNFVAYLVQYPGEKIPWAYVLLGEQGIGKDALLSPISTIIGLRNVAAIEAHHIEETFNPWALKQLVVLGELPSHHKKDIYERLKVFISGGQAELYINEKGTKQYTVRNRLNFFMFSNHEDALALPEGDRRYFIHRSPAVKQNPRYYTRYFKTVENPVFLSKLMSWLQARNLSSFEAKASPPMTDAKREMIEAARDAKEKWLREECEEGGKFHGRELIIVPEVVEAARNAVWGSGNLTPEIAKKITPCLAAGLLKRLGAKRLEGRHRVLGTDQPAVYVWALKRAGFYHRHVKKWSTEEFRARFQHDRDRRSTSSAGSGTTSGTDAEVVDFNRRGAGARDEVF